MTLSAKRAMLTSSNGASTSSSRQKGLGRYLKMPNTSAGKSADAASTATGASTIKDVTVGAAVFGSDGQKVGEIKGVKADPGGKVEEIHVKTGGVLGFGGKIVVVPGGKISKGGQTVQIAMTAAEIGKLPALVEKKS